MTKRISITRRDFLVSSAALGAATLMASRALAGGGFLEGTWIVRCPDGHDDQVDGLTANHDCEKCGRKAVSGGSAMVVCPKGHASAVGGITRSHDCQHRIPDGICGLPCRR